MSLSLMRKRFQATPAPSSTSPLWNLTPLRNLKRQVSGFTCSQLSASSPLISRVSGSRWVTFSAMLERIIRGNSSVCWCGSIVGGSLLMTIIILPFAWAAGVGVSAGGLVAVACAGAAVVGAGAAGAGGGGGAGRWGAAAGRGG